MTTATMVLALPTRFQARLGRLRLAAGHPRAKEMRLTPKELLGESEDRYWTPAERQQIKELLASELGLDENELIESVVKKLPDTPDRIWAANSPEYPYLAVFAELDYSGHPDIPQIIFVIDYCPQ